MAETYDVVVIGAGPGGYVCAIRAAQLGMKVACVDKRGAYGGTCLNVGCIPSKALLHVSEIYAEADHFNKMGIQLGKPKIDVAQMMAFKQAGVDGNTQGIEFLFKKNKIDGFKGEGVITSAGEVMVNLLDGQKTTLKTKNIVIATGSDVATLGGIEIDENLVVSSTGALEFATTPKSMIIVGAGVIGLELGSVWARLGTAVTVIEFLDRITPGVDGEVAKQFQRVLEKQGLKFMLGHKVTGIERLKASAKVMVEPAQAPAQDEGKSEGKSETLSAERVLIAVGRRPFTDGLGLEHIGVKLDAQGRVETDAHFATSVKGIYAIGDVIKGAMLAHKAEEEGVALAEMLAGQKPHVNYELVPSVIYTAPEVAWIGKTEEELKQAGQKYNVGKFPFLANGRAKVNGTIDGFVKILADAETDRVLGVHILGHDAGNMIAEAGIAMEFGASAEDIARTCHAHPTLSEAVKEAALAVDGRALHM